MSASSLFVIVLLLAGVLPEDASREESFCDGYVSQFGAAPSTQEQRVVLEICRAEFPGFKGPVVAVGKTYLPLPSEFYIVADQAEYLVAFTSVDANLGQADWPYTIAGISRGSPFDSIEADRVFIQSLPAPRLAKACEMDIELRSLEVQHFDSGFVQRVSEARFDGYSLAIFGQSTVLLRAIMDVFVRINCDQHEFPLDSSNLHGDR
jgi:hypothetical protein